MPRKPAKKNEWMRESKNNSIEKEQPEINIGLVGHVDHGKTTLLERLSGKWADTHSEELKRGITIRLGYADIIFRKCVKCKGTNAYTVQEDCPKCNSKTVAIRKVSFVDAPGHESLMATMLSGAAIIDYALLLIAANEPCPQPQTREHLMALRIIGVEKIIVIQNKIDLVDKERALKNYREIKDFLQNTRFKDTLIIPISAQYRLNLDVLIEAIEKNFKTPKRNLNKNPLMFVARSFDINKPGTRYYELKGGVLGGALKQGAFKKGEEIEIRPGRLVEEKHLKTYKPIRTKIESLMTGGNVVNEVRPGGSIALLTSLDPFIVKSDSLAGSIVGLPDKLPDVLDELIFEVHLLERVVGSKEELEVEPIKMNEILMLNVNSAATVGVVYKIMKNTVTCKLKLPVCTERGSRVTISRKIGNRFRLIGYGVIQ
jgi:translation initiation factor 2 subunit 3